MAALNGTLRDDENQVCQNCGNLGHRKYDCPEQRNYTANIICRVCGSAGHMARDCSQRRGDPNGFNQPFGGPPGGAPAVPGPPKTKFDSEYDSLMAELGEKTGVSGGGQPGPNGAPFGDAPGGLMPEALSRAGFTQLPPWRRPDVWQAPGGGGQGFRPQQPGYGGQQNGYGGAGYGQQGYGGYNGQSNQQWAGNYNQSYDSNAYQQYYQNGYQQH